MIQPKLPLSGVGLKYECANPECFYCGALMDLEDVVWKDYWSPELKDLTLVPFCPSCNDPMMIWDEEGD